MGGVSACEDDATAVETRAICDAVVCEYIGVLVGGCVPLRVCLPASCAAAARHVDPQAKVMVLRRREERREEWWKCEGGWLPVAAHTFPGCS